tara:strand:+ start:323 stop:577 length:255 start_codon:yes stop_codon:yes gene_type:complete
MRDYSITRKEGEWYKAKVTDSYGQLYMNYFEHAYEANDWIYSVWEREDWFNSVDSDELLANAIWGCTKLDQELGLLKGNEDNLD